MVNLSYSLEKKKDKLIEQKKKMKWYLKILQIPFVISILLGLYIVFSIDKFIYYLFPFFAASGSTTAQLKTIDVTLLYMFAASAGVTAIIYLALRNLKEKHDDLREDVIKNIGTGFCNCKLPCNCKDEFIKEMEKEKIDLIFEK